MKRLGTIRAFLINGNKYGKTTRFIFLILFLLLEAGHAKLEVYMADPEIRIAQKIYCELSGVTSTMRLQATLDNVVIFQKNSDLQPEEVFMADHRSQRAGTHKLTVSLLDESNQILETVTKNWTTLHSGLPTVGIDENNSIRYRGELFFPVYALLDGPTLIDYWVENGYVNANANCRWLPDHPNFSDYTIEEYRDWLDHCYGLGIGIIGPANRWAGIGESQLGRGNDTTIMGYYVESLKDHPGVLMWQWADEPDGGGATNCASPTEVRSWTRVCHRYDTNHPHAVNLTAYAWARDGAWYTLHCGDYSYLYGSDWHGGEKQLVGDIIGFDFYPIEFATKIPEKFGDLQVNFETMAKALDRLVEWNHNLCPIFSWNEPCDLNPDTDGDGFADGHLYSPYLWTPPPTSEELWAEYWLKIIHGVKGFNLHPFFDPAGTSFPPYNHQTMAKFIKWMEALKHGILGAEYTGKVYCEVLSGGRIDIMAKTSMDTLFLVSGNLRKEQEKARFHLNSLRPAQQVTVYGEDRIIPAQDGYFDDDFDALAVHIYKLVYKEMTQLENHKVTIPEYSLNQNYPNPFNSATTISYTLPDHTRVRIDIYNIACQKIYTLIDDIQLEGTHTIRWDAASFPTGQYLYIMKSGGFSQTKYMVHLK
jgi:hypothetical protein